MIYLIAKSIHIIGVVSWFAGLFYLVRLFVYHSEAQEMSAERRDILQPQYQIMIRRLYTIITTPAMMITVAAGITMLFINPGLLNQSWMIAKLGLVVSLLIYHGYCARIIAHLNDNKIRWQPFRFRLFNELATIILVAVVFLVVMKNTFNALYGLIGFIMFAILLFAGASWYRSRRESKINP